MEEETAEAQRGRGVLTDAVATATASEIVTQCWTLQNRLDCHPNKLEENTTEKCSVVFVQQQNLDLL